MTIALDHILVHYHSSPELMAFLQSFPNVAGLDRRVIVVDTGSTGGERAALASLQGRAIEVLTPGANLGYFGGVRFALESIDGSGQFADWLLVSNCDLTYTDGDLLSVLGQAAAEGVAVLSPRVLSGTTGRDQNPYLLCKPSLTRSLLLALALSHPRTARAAKRHHKGAGHDPLSPTHDPETQQVWAPHGSCFFVHKKFFSNGGNLNWPGFLFNEEIHVGLELERTLLAAKYDPRLVFHHDEHRSTGAEGASLVVFRAQRRSSWIAFGYLLRHRSKRAWRSVPGSE